VNQKPKRSGHQKKKNSNNPIWKLQLIQINLNISHKLPRFLYIYLFNDKINSYNNRTFVLIDLKYLKSYINLMD